MHYCLAAKSAASAEELNSDVRRLVRASSSAIRSSSASQSEEGSAAKGAAVEGASGAVEGDATGTGVVELVAVGCDAVLRESLVETVDGDANDCAPAEADESPPPKRSPASATP